MTGPLRPIPPRHVAPAVGQLPHAAPHVRHRGVYHPLGAYGPLPSPQPLHGAATPPPRLGRRPAGPPGPCRPAVVDRAAHARGHGPAYMAGGSVGAPRHGRERHGLRRGAQQEGGGEGPPWRRPQWPPHQLFGTRRPHPGAAFLPSPPPPRRRDPSAHRLDGRAGRHTRRLLPLVPSPRQANGGRCCCPVGWPTPGHRVARRVGWQPPGRWPPFPPTRRCWTIGRRWQNGSMCSNDNGRGGGQRRRGRRRGRGGWPHQLSCAFIAAASAAAPVAAAATAAAAAAASDADAHRGQKAKASLAAAGGPAASWRRR